MNKTQIALDFIKDYPEDFPNLTLARLLYRESPSAFKDIEDARGAVRNAIGQMGKKSKKTAEKRNSYKKEKTKSPYALPKTWANPKTVFKLPTQCNRIGFISDAQVPFHDVEAIETAYAYLKERKINTLFINSDWMDFYQLSNFQKDPRKRDFEQEYYTILQSFEHMRHEFPDVTIYYNMDGNHELRYERYMSIKAPELVKIKLPEFSLEAFLKLHLFNIIPLKNNHHIMIGKLPVVHGHTIFQGQTSPVSTARTVWTKAKQSAIVSHCHQVSEYTVRAPFTGDLHTCWTTGCLMDLNVEYNQHGHNYGHGCAYIETDRDGSYRVENKRIFNGRVL